jgi:hypothetical protein
MGYEIKTKASEASPLEFVQAVEKPQRKEDALELLDIFQQITKEKPILWRSGLGDGIIGYGIYSYVSKSGCKGEWMKTGFAPRKSNLVLYIMTGLKKYSDLTQKLGKHKTSVSCLYLNKLADVDLKILKQIIRKDYEVMCEKYPL